MEAEVSIGTLLWTFLNSPVGISVVVSILAWILAKIFTSRPAWEESFHTYKGLFFDAVRYAEKKIPGTTESAAAAKADAALQYVLKLEGPLNKKKEADLRRALTEAHAEIEAKSNDA